MNRLQPKTLAGAETVAEPYTTLETIQTHNPLSNEYQAPAGASFNVLCTYFIARQKQKYGTVVKIPRAGLRKNLQRLVNLYGTVNVYRAIDYSLSLSDFPFSTKFMEEQLCGALKTFVKN